MDQRKIIHIDLDAFYASVEQRDRPELKGKPVVVGGDPKGRGVIAAASYEARKFGVRSAMSSAKALKLCPHLVFLSPDFKKYNAVSEQVHRIFEEVTSLIEPISLDEAYLDVTENRLGEPLAREVAKYLKRRIVEVTKLTASAGVAPNKLVAKIASDMKKPDGLVVVPPEKVLAFLEKLPVEKIWGVGPATAKQLHEMGLITMGDIRKCSVNELEARLGKYGPFLHALASGNDTRPVDTDREPKSRGTETTFEKDVLDVAFLLETLAEQARELARDLKEIERPGRTVTLKLRYKDFTTITRSLSSTIPMQSPQEILRIASRLLLEETDAGREPVRLIGISVSSLIDVTQPLQLWLDLPLP